MLLQIIAQPFVLRKGVFIIFRTFVCFSLIFALRTLFDDIKDTVLLRPDPDLVNQRKVLVQPQIFLDKALLTGI